MACDQGLLNTAQLGIGFFLIFTAYVTCCNIQVSYTINFTFPLPLTPALSASQKF